MGAILFAEDGGTSDVAAGTVDSLGTKISVGLKVLIGYREARTSQLQPPSRELKTPGHAETACLLGTIEE